MVKIIKKDYPWTIIVEDKISKNQNPYVSIGVGFTDEWITTTNRYGIEVRYKRYSFENAKPKKKLFWPKIF